MMRLSLPTERGSSPGWSTDTVEVDAEALLDPSGDQSAQAG